MEFTSCASKVRMNDISPYSIGSKAYVRYSFGSSETSSQNQLVLQERGSIVCVMAEKGTCVESTERTTIGSIQCGIVSIGRKMSLYTRGKQLSASCMSGILRNTYSTLSHTRLYSAAVEDVPIEQRKAGVVDPRYDAQPINLFHSVLCGSYDSNPTIETSSAITVSAKRNQGKAPIIVLPGLLGSARNFQSWMKLVQQCEVDLNRDDAKREKREVKH